MTEPGQWPAGSNVTNSSSFCRGNTRQDGEMQSVNIKCTFVTRETTKKETTMLSVYLSGCFVNQRNLSGALHLQGNLKQKKKLKILQCKDTIKHDKWALTINSVHISKCLVSSDSYSVVDNTLNHHDCIHSEAERIIRDLQCIPPRRSTWGCSAAALWSQRSSKAWPSDCKYNTLIHNIIHGYSCS